MIVVSFLSVAVPTASHFELTTFVIVICDLSYPVATRGSFNALCSISTNDYNIISLYSMFLHFWPNKLKKMFLQSMVLLPGHFHVFMQTYSSMLLMNNFVDVCVYHIKSSKLIK